MKCSPSQDIQHFYLWPHHITWAMRHAFLFNPPNTVSLSRQTESNKRVTFDMWFNIYPKNHHAIAFLIPKCLWWITPKQAAKYELTELFAAETGEVLHTLAIQPINNLFWWCVKGIPRASPKWRATELSQQRAAAFYTLQTSMTKHGLIKHSTPYHASQHSKANQ